MKRFLSVLLVFSLMVPVSAATTSVGGYMDTEYVSGTDSATFKAHRMILYVGSEIHENIHFNSEIEYEYGGDAGNSGEIKIEKAYVDVALTEGMGVRTGLIVMPVGYENINHDSNMRDATNRSYYSKYIVPSTWSDTGIGIVGNLELANDWGISYQSYIVNGLQNDIDGTNGLRNARPNFKQDNNQSSAFVGRLTVSPKAGLDLGASLYTGEYDNDGNNVTLFAVDGLHKRGPFEVLAEYGIVSIDQSVDEPTDMSGGYIEGRYHFMPEFIKTKLNKQGYANPTFTAFARINQIDLDKDVEDTKDLTTYTIGLNFRPVENVAFKIEYETSEEGEGDVDNNAIYASIAAGF